MTKKVNKYKAQIFSMAFHSLENNASIRAKKQYLDALKIIKKGMSTLQTFIMFHRRRQTKRYLGKLDLKWVIEKFRTNINKLSLNDQQLFIQYLSKPNHRIFLQKKSYSLVKWVRIYRILTQILIPHKFMTEQESKGKNLGIQQVPSKRLLRPLVEQQPQIKQQPKIQSKNEKNKFSKKQRKLIKRQKKIQEVDDQKIRTKKLINLGHNTPKCPNKKCRSILEDKKCSDADHFIIFCPDCSWNEHQCIQSDDRQDYYKKVDKLKYKDWDKIQILANGETVGYDMKSIKPLKRKNNIQQYLKNEGYIYTKHLKYFPTLLNKFTCKYPIMSQSTTVQILQNRQNQLYLPLQIKKSSIKNAGLGVFATTSIPGGRIVCSYLGQAGNISSIPSHRQVYQYGKKTKKYNLNDSLFTLGWLQRQALLIAPSKFSNVGRFINYNKPQKCNLIANIALIKTEDNKIQPTVFLASQHKIQKGDELFYQYGPFYDLNDLQDK